MSPARMYSLARSTIAWYAAGVMLDTGSAALERPALSRPRMRAAAVEVAHRVDHPLRRLGVGGARAEAGAGPDGRHHRDLVLARCRRPAMIGRAQHDRVGQAERVGIDVRQSLDQPHHVVAEIAEQAGGHRRQPGGSSIRLSAISARGSRAVGRALGSTGVGIEAGARG